MRCPSCAEDDDAVLETRATARGGEIRRRRQCKRCGWRYTTYERPDESELVVIKRDGRHEPFDVEKLRRGIAAATSGLGVTDEQIDDVVTDVIASSVPERLRIRSDAIGAAVERRLQELQPMAFVRFASVFRRFEHAAQFVEHARSVDSRFMVEKADGRRQMFDESKVRRGVERAATKSALEGESGALETLVGDVLTELRASYAARVNAGEPPVMASRDIGDVVKRHLRTMDAVAYIRFATVFEKIDDTRMFEQVLAETPGEAPR